jgi:molecular chaperone GrpE
LEDKDTEKDKEQEAYTEDDIELVTDEPEEGPEEKATFGSGADELNNKYLRLYADFENYRKRVNRDKEELVRYGNESLLYELLPAIDNLELALKHATCDDVGGIVQGVEMSLRELQRTLEKFGLSRIEAAGKCFDPAVHHAMSQVERNDMDEKMVAEEFRAGYKFRDKVLRPSLVSVSVKPQKQESSEPEAVEIKIQDKIEEEQ